MDSYFPTSVSRPQWCSLCPVEPIYPHVNLILHKRWTLNEPDCTPSSQLEFLKTSYIISLTESLDWSNVLWLVNASKSLNGHWMVFRSPILSPSCNCETTWKSHDSYLMSQGMLLEKKPIFLLAIGISGESCRLLPPPLPIKAWRAFGWWRLLSWKVASSFVTWTNWLRLDHTT